MNESDAFYQAVTAIDAGDVERLQLLLAAHPRLVSDRLDGSPEGLPVTSAEKQAYGDNNPSQPNISISTSIDRGGGVTSVSSRPMPFREPRYWPEVKDPFGNAPHSVLASPTGEVWILKQLPHTEKNPTYDVIGTRGELTGGVIIPPRSRVIGFGQNGAVYVVRWDDDDLQYLARFRIR